MKKKAKEDIAREEIIQREINALETPQEVIAYIKEKQKKNKPR